MAGFTVNIGAQIVEKYVVTANALFSAKDCVVPTDKEHTIGLIENTLVLSPAYHLLTGYSDASSWKTLKIKNIVYSHPTTVYLSDTLTKIPEAGATVYDFNITGQAVDIAIPNLTMTYNNYTPVQNATITFDLAIENLALEVGLYTTVTLLINYVQCAPVSQGDLIIAIIADNTCSIQHSVNVIVPLESTRFVVVSSIDNFGITSDTTTGETISVDTLYNLEIDASNTGEPYSVLSQVSLKVYNDSGMSVLIDSHIITREHQGNIC